MKGLVDKESCIGCGLCAAMCPEVFDMDQDGRAKATDNDIEDKLLDSAKDAEMQCPVGAITFD